MKRRSFLQFLGLGATAVAAPLAAQPRPAKPAAALKLPIGTVLPFEEVHYETAPVNSFDPNHTHAFSITELPSHTHTFSSSHGGVAAVAHRRIVYKQWDGRKWVPVEIPAQT